MKNRLENKIIVVTGGNGLLGSEIIKRLKIEGAFLINLDVNHKTNENLSNIECDVTSEESINNALNLIIQKYSRIDGWVNNAYPRTEDWGNKFEDIDYESWKKNIDLQLGNVFLCCKHVLEHMKKNKYGSIVNIASAFTTMLASYPLLFLEDLGIALLVGFGSIVGSIIAIYYVIKIYKKNISFVGFNFKSLLTSFPASIWMVAHPLVVSTLLLLIPIIINNHYGLKALGLFSSATIITAVVTMVLMSAMKTYFLPTLGTIQSLEEKNFYINKIIYFLLILIFPIIIFSMFFAKILLFTLFSGEFVVAYKLLIIQMISVLSAAFCWPYANYILHNGNFRAYFIIDTIWASALALMIFYLADKNYDLIIIPLIFLLGSFISVALYLIAVKLMYGEGALSIKNLKLGIYFFLIISLTYIVISQFNLYLQTVWAFILVVSFIFFIRQQNVKNSWNT